MNRRKLVAQSCSLSRFLKESFLVGVHAYDADWQLVLFDRAHESGNKRLCRRDLFEDTDDLACLVGVLDAMAGVSLLVRFLPGVG